MTLHLDALSVDALDPPGLAAFWSAVLGRALDDSADRVVPTPDDDTGFPIRFTTSGEPRTRPNQMHFDLTSSSPTDQQETVVRALDLGARHHDVGQRGDEGHVVLADPEGNEFCVIEPGNRFLAGCGRLGALAGDGSQQVGYFWSRALGWPLVWDQDQETAIQSPRGGPKITWGGPPVAPKSGPNRLRLELRISPGDDLTAEVDRLASLGATRLDPAPWDDGRVWLTDPDGNEFGLAGSPLLPGLDRHRHEKRAGAPGRRAPGGP